MKRGSALALLLLAACGAPEAPLPPVDVRIRLEAHVRSVRPGQGFALDVIRTWRKELEPAPWDDELLAPLVVRAESVARREDGRRIEERRRFRAYAFTRTDVRVPAVPFAARPADGGELRIAASRPLRLRVAPEVDPEAPGAPELPGALPGRGVPWVALLGLLGVLAAVAAWLGVRGRRRPPPAEAPAVQAPPPETQARAALARLRAAGGTDPAADVEAVARIVRRYVGLRFDVDSAARTTEELDAIAQAGAVLGPCDRVKFGAHVPTRAERDGVIRIAEAYLGRRP